MIKYFLSLVIPAKAGIQLEPRQRRYELYDTRTRFWIPAFAGMTILIAAFFSFEAHASNPKQCYSPNELRAEELLRLHSELMVITVTCHQGSKGESLVPYYTGFTQANIKLLHSAEQTMEKHYKICFGGSGIDSLDRLRTKLGNEYGQKIADESAPKFCSEWRDKVVQMYAATPAQLETEVQLLTMAEKPYEQLCPAPHTHIAKEGQ